jgi:hypothetical protein
MQYTIRDVPKPVDTALRHKAKRDDKSLNTVAIEALQAGSGVSDQPVQHHDLDALAGTWKEDSAFDQAVADQDQVDERIWK